MPVAAAPTAARRAGRSGPELIAPPQTRVRLSPGLMHSGRALPAAWPGPTSTRACDVLMDGCDRHRPPPRRRAAVGRQPRRHRRSAGSRYSAVVPRQHIAISARDGSGVRANQTRPACRICPACRSRTARRHGDRTVWSTCTIRSRRGLDGADVGAVGLTASRRHPPHDRPSTSNGSTRPRARSRHGSPSPRPCRSHRPVTAGRRPVPAPPSR